MNSGPDKSSILDAGRARSALKLADRGMRVAAVDPAPGSIAAARAKSGAERVHWITGRATDVTDLQVDAVTMTGNTAQAITDPSEWAATLNAALRLLRPGGHLVFESRRPAYRAWDAWNQQASQQRLTAPCIGTVDCWGDLTELDGPLVSFRWTFTFHADGAVLTSDSALRFRERDEIEADLAHAGYAIKSVRQAPTAPTASTSSSPTGPKGRLQPTPSVAPGGHGCPLCLHRTDHRSTVP
jgi:SAM-dependent methyltransferase